jgi:hypothetical protein
MRSLEISKAVAAALSADGVELICAPTTASSKRRDRASAGSCRPLASTNHENYSCGRPLNRLGTCFRDDGYSNGCGGPSIPYRRGPDCSRPGPNLERLIQCPRCSRCFRIGFSTDPSDTARRVSLRRSPQGQACNRLEHLATYLSPRIFVVVTRPITEQDTGIAGQGPTFRHPATERPFALPPGNGTVSHAAAAPTVRLFATDRPHVLERSNNRIQRQDHRWCL